MQASLAPCCCREAASCLAGMHARQAALELCQAVQLSLPAAQLSSWGSAGQSLLQLSTQLLGKITGNAAANPWLAAAGGEL